MLQHIGGYAPCPLCLDQRHLHYVAVPFCLLSVIFLHCSRHGSAAACAFLAAAAFASSAALGGWQAGVEWGLWEGFSGCMASNVPTDHGNLLSMIMATPYASCNVPAIRILNLSLAGWNAIVSSASAFLVSIAATAVIRGHGKTV